jgi:hypothetical protein
LKQYDECVEDLENTKETQRKQQAALLKGQAKLQKLEADGLHTQQRKTEHTAQFDELNREIEEAKIAHAQATQEYTVAKRPMLQLKTEETRVTQQLGEVTKERADTQR